MYSQTHSLVSLKTSLFLYNGKLKCCLFIVLATKFKHDSWLYCSLFQYFANVLFKSWRFVATCTKYVNIVSLSLFNNFCIFQTFLLYLLQWSVPNDLWSDCCNCVVFHTPPSLRWQFSHESCVFSIAPPIGYFSVSLTLLKPHYSLRHSSLDIRPVKYPIMIYKCLSKRKSPSSHT